jgi:hypothetical protein
MERDAIVGAVAHDRGWPLERAASAVDQLLATNKWSPLAIYLGFRADFKCEYCGRDLLESVDSYKLWEHDHISPGGADEPDNLALACLICNCKLKNRWWKPDITGGSGSREDRINQVRLFLADRRAALEPELDKIRTLVRA